MRYVGIYEVLEYALEFPGCETSFGSNVMNAAILSVFGSLRVRRDAEHSLKRVDEQNCNETVPKSRLFLDN